MFNGNKKFYKFVYGYVKNMQPEGAKEISRKVIDSMHGKLPVIELFKLIGQIKVELNNSKK